MQILNLLMFHNNIYVSYVRIVLSAIQREVGNISIADFSQMQILKCFIIQRCISENYIGKSVKNQGKIKPIT